jgi:predicted transcriptional regulator
MSVQLNVRLDEAIVESLDGWAIVRGVSRPALVKEAIVEWLRHQDAAQIEAKYRQAYADHPETDDELQRAEESATRLIDEEPWEKWW